MVECICIDDSGRPDKIPQSKWVKEGTRYNIIYTVRVLPQNEVGVMLSEIELTDNELPYEYFLLRRFAFTEDNLMKLVELIKDCTDTDFSVEEILIQTQLEDV